MRTKHMYPACSYVTSQGSLRWWACQTQISKRFASHTEKGGRHIREIKKDVPIKTENKMQ